MNENMALSTPVNTEAEIPYYVTPGLADETTDEGLLALYKIRSESENPLTDHFGKQLDIVGYMIHNAEVENEAGELKNMARIILVDAEGTAYTAVSTGVYNSLKTIVTTVGEPSPDRHFIMVAKQKQGKNKYKFTSLELVEIVRPAI